MLVSDGDVVEQIQALTGGFGVDVAIDAVGRPETWKQAFYGRDLAGTVVLVGVPTPTMTLEMPLLDFFGRGGSLKSSWYGDCLPSRDFPVLSELFLQGRLPLDKFVSETIGIDRHRGGVRARCTRRGAAVGRGDVALPQVTYWHAPHQQHCCNADQVLASTWPVAGQSVVGLETADRGRGLGGVDAPAAGVADAGSALMLPTS